MFYSGRRLILYFSLFCYIIGGSCENYEKVFVTVGEVICLECVFSDQNTVGVEWRHNDRRIMIHDVKSNITKKFDGYSSVLKNLNGSSCLEFHVNSSGEFGSYDCVIYSGTGSNEKITWIIQLQSKDDVVANVTVFMPVGKHVALNCTWDTSKSPTAVKWQREDRFILNHEVESFHLKRGKYFSRIDNNTAWLEIPAVDFDDSGVYSCFLTFMFHKKKRPSATWVLQVQGHPQVFITTNVTNENETFDITCCIEFGLLPTNLEIQWLLSGRKLEFDAVTKEFKEGNKTLCSNLTFVIRRDNNQQSLDCLVRNEINESSSVILSVLYPPFVKIDLEASTRSFFSFPQMATMEGQLQCIAEGNPLPVVTLETLLSDGNWQGIFIDSYVELGTGATSVWTFPLENMDYGFYRCAANNGIGLTQVSQEVNIDPESNITFIVILCLAAITTLMIILKLAACLRASIAGYRVQEVTSTNTARSRQMDDIGTQGNYENYLVPNQSLPYASPSYKDFSSLRALHHVYMKKTTRAVEPTEDHEEDYMNSFREDVYSNTQI